MSDSKKKKEMLNYGMVMRINHFLTLIFIIIIHNLSFERIAYIFKVVYIAHLSWFYKLTTE